MLVLEHFLSLSPFSAWISVGREVLDAAAPLAKGDHLPASLSSIYGEDKVSDGADIGRKI